MDAYKRIFKRGALALAVTIVIAIYGFKAKDWTKGLFSDFIVYAQTVITPTNTVTDNRSTNHIFAQVADGLLNDGSGLGYTSTLVVSRMPPLLWVATQVLSA